MCGIAGLYNWPVRSAEAQAMIDRIAHRGPDAEGVWSHTDDNVSVHLGHRRLSIIDVRVTNNQPFVKDGIVFAYKNPASYTSNGTTLVYREYWDVETLPQGYNAFDILSSKLTLKWDVAPFFVIVSELRYTHDSNRSKFIKSDDDAGRIRVFEDPNITNRLGFFLLTQARW